jgi:glycosyltransferase involved in cell wall biosynthesis
VNILFLDQFSDPGGGQLCLRDLMPGILQRGWKPRIMMPGSGEMLKWSAHAGIPAHTLPLQPYSNGHKTVLDILRFGVDGPRMAAAVREVVRREHVDLVYVNGPRVLPAVLGVSAPVVFHAHSHVGVRYGRKLLEWTLQRAKAQVIAASRYVAQSYSQVLGDKRVQVIYNGIADFQGGSRRFPERPLRVGIIGRIAPEKGQIHFVRAAKELAESGVAAEFFVFGERMFADADYEADVRAAAQNAPVTFRGWTNDVGSALHELDILAVPSGRDEAATRVIIEAFSAGTPVVAFRSGGIPELVHHGRTGLLTWSPDFQSLARSIKALMDDRVLMKRLSSAGRREWRRRFRVESFRTAVCDLLEDYAGRFPRPHQR